VRCLSSRLPHLPLNAWYLDDGARVGSRSDLHRALEIIGEGGGPLGLHLNLPKCELWWPTRTDDWEVLPRDIIRVPNDGVILLGVPIGTEEYVTRAFEGICAKLADLHSSIMELHDSQVQYTLTRACLGFCRVNHILRSCHPDETLRGSRLFDASLRRLLSGILMSSDIGDKAWAQASLPIELGGLSTAHAELVRRPAYVASCIAASGLVSSMVRGVTHSLGEVQRLLSCHNADTRSTWTLQDLVTTPADDGDDGESDDDRDVTMASTPDSDISSDDGDGSPEPTPSVDPLSVDTGEVRKGIQRLLSADVWRTLRDRLLSGAEDREAARLRCISSLYASSFLRALPLRNLGLRFHTKLFVIAVRRHLGLQVFDGSSQCPSCRRAVLDPLGDHALLCRHGSGVFHRHNRLRDILFSLVKASGLGATREAPRVVHYSRMRPGDIMTYYEFRSGHAKNAYDVSVTNTFARATLARAAKAAGAACQDAEGRKRSKYLAVCSAQHIAFTPLIFESLGFVSDEVSRCISRWTTLAEERGGDFKEKWSRQLVYAKLSVALQEENARMVFARSPEGAAAVAMSPEDDPHLLAADGSLGWGRWVDEDEGDEDGGGGVTSGEGSGGAAPDAPTPSPGEPVVSAVVAAGSSAPVGCSPSA